MSFNLIPMTAEGARMTDPTKGEQQEQEAQQKDAKAPVKIQISGRMTGTSKDGPTVRNPKE